MEDKMKHRPSTALAAPLLAFYLALPAQAQQAQGTALGDTLALAAEVAALRDTLAGREQTLLAMEEESRMLQAQTDELTLAHLKDSIAALEAQAQALDGQIDSMESQLKALRQDMAQQGDQLKRLQQTPTLRAQRTYDANKALLDLPFSQMPTDGIATLLATLQQFASQDDYTDYKAKAERIAQFKSAYDDGVAMLDRPYDHRAFMAAYNPVHNLLAQKQHMTTAQYGEMDTLDLRLSRYHHGIKTLQNLIRRTNANAKVKQARANGDADACRTAIKNARENELSEDYHNVLEKYIPMVPALKRLWDEYEQAVETNPLGTTAVEREILNIRTQ